MIASGLQLDACSVTTAGVENGGDHYEPTMALCGLAFRCWAKSDFQ